MEKQKKNSFCSLAQLEQEWRDFVANKELPSINELDNFEQYLLQSYSNFSYHEEHAQCLFIMAENNVYIGVFSYICDKFLSKPQIHKTLCFYL